MMKDQIIEEQKGGESFGTILLRRRHLLGGRGEKLGKFADG